MGHAFHASFIGQSFPNGADVLKELADGAQQWNDTGSAGLSELARSFLRRCTRVAENLVNVSEAF